MKAKSAFVLVCFILSLVFANGAVNAATFVLEGGINTQESWYSMSAGVETDIVTAHPYDVVGTMYTEPGQVATLRIVTEKELDPFIARGTGSFSWNSEGFWEFSVTSDNEGVIEIVLRVEKVSPLPGRTVIVAAWIEGHSSQQWSATVSTGSSPMVLSGGINTPDGWINAVIGETVDIFTDTMFDIVGTVYTDPAVSVNMRVGTQKEQDPFISRGTGTFSWNSEGFWELSVTSDNEGVVEVVVHSEEIYPLPGRVVFVSAWSTDQAAQTWYAAVSNGEHPISLNGGINTQESWYSAHDGDELVITTGHPFDIVGTVYTEPNLSITVRIETDKEQDPFISRGTGTFFWNSEGFWELSVTSDNEGVVEVVLHVETVATSPGKNHSVSAWYGDQTAQSWTANVASGIYQVFLPLIVR